MIDMRNKRIIMYFIIFIFLVISLLRVFYICAYKYNYYEKQYKMIKNKTTFLSSSNRGRILDRNGKVLVKNEGVNTLIFNKLNKKNKEDEIKISTDLASILDLDLSDLDDSIIKEYYLVTHDDGKNLITKSEWDKYNKRKITDEKITNLKYKRITKQMIDQMGDQEKKSAYIYYKLNNGYYYQDKIIKKELTDEELAKINNLSFNSLKVVTTYKRVYPYGNILRDLFGIVASSVPKELKGEYLKKGVPLNSSVGVSGLEKYYDKYLRGKDAIYKVGENNKLHLISKEQKGKDLYLSIDIDIEQKINEILGDEIKKAKNFKSSKYYNHSFVLVGNPKTGEIISINGLKMNNNGSLVDISSLASESSYTVGSVVKGATISVGYQNNLIKPGFLVYDSCVKVKNVQKKCSWKRLGKIDDIKALAYSSNYYQFLIASRLANPNYKWNASLDSNKEHFDIYRKTLSSYGLGSKTYIDLPNEKSGLKGRGVSDDLLLNLAIGQYDAYTPLELLQYINTVASNGERYRLSLMKKITDKNENIVKINKKKLINKVDLDQEYISRIKKGFEGVIRYGTGKGYTDKKINAAGKTGTSETFIDTDNDNRVDTKTISTAFVMYAPSDDPKYSIIIISPNIGITKGDKSVKYAINLYLNKKISSFLFENS